jgi:NAD(P)-dependent dehydrogenase (short-subunit alcohol dehydrogenase family)
MKGQKRGIIHNVSSPVGLSGFPGLCGYASTKAAVEALSRTLRLDLKPYGIAVTIMPSSYHQHEIGSTVGSPATSDG